MSDKFWTAVVGAIATVVVAAITDEDWFRLNLTLGIVRDRRLMNFRRRFRNPFLNSFRFFSEKDSNLSGIIRNRRLTLSWKRWWFVIAITIIFPRKDHANVYSPPWIPVSQSPHSQRPLGRWRNLWHLLIDVGTKTISHHLEETLWKIQSFSKLFSRIWYKRWNNRNRIGPPTNDFLKAVPNPFRTFFLKKFQISPESSGITD